MATKKRGAGKYGAQAKENIQAVFVRTGGTAAMARWAKKNPGEFYKLYGRLIPHEVTGQGGGPIIEKVVREIVDAKK